MIDPETLQPVGTGLQRPECVLAHRSGLVICSDWSGTGGVSLIAPDGSVERLVATDAPRAMRPNGIALEPGGRILMADLGAEAGGVWRLDPSGAVEPVVVAVDGRPLPPTNFVLRDAEGRLWITVSTRRVPRDRAYRRDVADGFVVLADRSGARVVADGLGFANECAIDPTGRWLYVNETFGRRLTRFPLSGTGLGAGETVASFGRGIYPDGLTFDVEGAAWITSVVSNAVLRVLPDGRVETVLADADPDHVAWVETAYERGEIGRPHLDRIAGRRLRNLSSLAFGGPDLRTAYLGCLLGDEIMTFRSPVSGVAPPHWDHPLGALGRAANTTPPISSAN